MWAVMQLMVSGCQLWGSKHSPHQGELQLGTLFPTFTCPSMQTTSTVLRSFIKASPGTSVFGDSLLPLAPQSGNALSHNFRVGHCWLICRHPHLESEKANKITVCSFNFFSVPYSLLSGVFCSPMAGRLLPIPVPATPRSLPVSPSVLFFLSLSSYAVSRQRPATALPRWPLWYPWEG